MGRRAAFAFVVMACLVGCQSPAAGPITAAFQDDFERGELGSDWHATQEDTYVLSGGRLGAQGARNHPLWLRRAIPRNAVIEFTAWSISTDGDIKFEAWGDGKSYDPNGGSYAATGYVFVFGGWSNTKAIIAKKDEHGSELASRTDTKVERGRKYRFRVERKEKTIIWSIDGAEFLTFTDPAPLDGPRNAYFAFSNWESDSWFDDLTIRPL